MGGGGVTVTLLPSQQHVLIMKNSEVNCEKTRIFDDKIRDRRKRSDLEKNERQNCDLELGEFVPENIDAIATNNTDTKWKKGKKWEFNNSNSSNWGRWEYERKRNDRCFKKRDDKFEEGDKNMCRSKTFELEKGEFPRKNINSQKNSSYVDYEEEPGEFKYENNNGKANWKNKYSDNVEPKNRVNYAERAHGNSHSSLKASSLNKFNHPFRHNELHSRSSYDKQKFCDSRNQSPDKFPLERSRHFGYRDRSPEHIERSPMDRGHHYDHRDRSPEKSPMNKNCHYDSKDRSPHYDRSPFDRGRHYNHRDHSPAYSERSPIDQARHLDTRDHSPTYSDRSPVYRSRHYDARDRSPAYSERSHINKTSHYDARDRSPMQYERSPVERNRHYDSRSFMDRSRNYDYRDRDHSPLERARHFDSKERDPQDHRRIPAVNRDRNKKSGGTEKQHLSITTTSSSSKYEERQKKGSTKNGLLKLPNSTLNIMTTGSSNIERSGSIDAKSNKNSKNLLEPNELPPLPPSSPPPPPPLEVPPPPSSPHPGSNSNGIVDNMTSMEEDMDICDTPPHDLVQVDTKPGKWYYLDYMGYEQGPSKLDDLKKLVQEGYLLLDHMVKHSDSDMWLTVENATSPLVQLGHMPSTFADMVSPPEAQGSTLNDDDDGDPNEELQSDLVDEDLAKNVESVVESVEELNIDKRVDALLDGYNLVTGKELEVLGEALNSKFEHAEWEKWDMTEGFIRFRAHKVGPNMHGFDTNMHGFETENRTASSLEEIANVNNTSTDWFSIKWSCMGGDWKRNDESNHDRSLKKKIVLNHGYPLCEMPKCGNEDPRWHKREELYYSSGIRKLELPSWVFSVSEENNENSSEIDKTIISQMKPTIPRGNRGTIMPVVRINACVVRDYGSEAHPKSKHDRHFYRSSRSHGDRSYSVEGCSHTRMSPRTDLQNLHKSRTVLSIPRDHVCTIDELSIDLGDWYYLDGAGHEHGPYSYSDLQKMTLKGIIMENSSVFRKVDNAWLPITLSKEEAVGPSNSSNSFHESHPQFIGYTRGKLYELVMKSFKNREFAAAINEILDPWISEKQAKKELDRHYPNSSITKSGDKLWKSDDKYLTGKRPRYMYDGDSELIEDSFVDNASFDDLRGEANFINENPSIIEPENENWGLLNGHILARIFHFIRSDVKSLICSSATCKRWNLASKFYRNLCTNVDFSSVGPGCSDSMFQNIMYGYAKNKLTSIILTGCSNITASVLEEMLHMFTSISLVDIRGCSQFYDLMSKFHEIKWIKSCSHSNSRSLENIAYSEDSSIHPFRQGVYKRAKLFDSRKSSEVMSRDAQRRRWLHRKSENGYRKMKESITVGMKNIMKENTCEYFIPKVAQIEDRIRNGYYIRHGLRSVKDDISRMCRDAIKLKNRGSFKEMKHIVKLFMNLARSLEGNPTNDLDELQKTKDSLEIHSNKKKLGKAVDKKSIKPNGHTDIFDAEIKRSLSKSKKRGMESSSESSDDHDNDFWDGDDKTDGETTESDTESDLDIRSRENKGNLYSNMDDSFDSISDDREWGARMTKASLVPPVTRKYEVIESYLPIADEEEVKRKMRVALPDDYNEKLQAQKSGLEESDMEIPEVKEYKSRKLLGVEVLEQEVYGIDPYTHNLLLDSMPKELEWQLANKHKFIEEVLLRTLNKQVRHFTGTGNTPMVYHLRPVVEEIYKNAETDGERRTMKLCQAIIKAMQSRPDDNYVAYRKGLGVVCNREGGFDLDDFVVEFLGEVYPAWKWFEKQDGIRSMQKNKEEPAPEFYNIYLERPKGDRDGYDLVVVDAMHKANYASRICHSCRPNCEAKVTAVDGQYQIGIYTVRPIGYGEEITFDYNSVTESKEEYEASVCLCGNHICRGSYLNLTGEDAFHKVLEESHGLLNRHKLMLDACESNFVLEEDYIDLGKAGLGTCLLSGLPDWLVAYSAHLVRFINLERTKLPEVILKHNLEEKRKFFADINIEDEKSDAEVQAEGVYNSRLQNMALTLDKVKYVMRRVFGDPKNAPPPLEKLGDSELVYMLWKGEGSLVDDLLHYMSPHMDTYIMNDLKSKIRAHDPSGSENVNRELRKSLLWLRDELRTLPCSSKCRHDAAADLIHIYAYTKCFYKVREYKTVTSPPVYISPLDLGPKYVDKMGSGFQEYCKTYGENYCLGQLIYWHSQTDADPDIRLARAKRGCLLLPDVSSFYVNHHKSVHELVYDSRTLRFIMNRMEKQPQRPWPKDRIWQFTNNQKFFGSPMLDSVINKSPLDKEMMQWLKTRPTIYNGIWDG